MVSKGQCDTLALRNQLHAHALEECLPHLRQLKGLAPVVSRLSVLLVGSVATGSCNPDSDIDIALLANDDCYTHIKSRMSGCAQRWEIGRPTEEVIAGRRCHWYVIALPEVKRRLLCHNDQALYSYGTAEVLSDPHGQFKRILGRYGLQRESVRRACLEGKLDMLLRRSRALPTVVPSGRIAVASVILEIVVLALKTVSLVDGLAISPRKLLYETALQGRVGKRLKPSFLRVLSTMGQLGSYEGLPESLAVDLLKIPLQQIERRLCQESRRLGAKVKLDCPDPRHFEPQIPPHQLWQAKKEWPKAVKA